MGIGIWHKFALTGGGTTALDGIATASIADSDVCHVYAAGKYYYMVFDADATDAESSPSVIRPDDYSTAGVWKLGASPYGDVQVQPEIVSGLPITGGISGGDVTVSGNTLTITPTTCLDSGLTTKLYTSANQTLVIPSAANTEYFVFLVKLVAGGTFEFRAYTTLAGVASDAAVDKYRFVSWCKTDGSSVVMPFIQNDDTIEFLGANLPQISATLTTSLASYAVSTVVSVLCSEITYKSYNSVAYSASYSFDGTNIFGVTSHQNDRVTTVKTASIYAKYTTANCSVKIAKLKIRR